MVKLEVFVSLLGFTVCRTIQHVISKFTVYLYTIVPLAVGVAIQTRTLVPHTNIAH